MLERLKTEISRKYEKMQTKDFNRESLTENNFNENLLTSRNKQKAAITQLKLLHNSLEDNYIQLLKKLSKQILKPKDLIRRPDPTIMGNKIK